MNGNDENNNHEIDWWEKLEVALSTGSLDDAQICCEQLEPREAILSVMSHVETTHSASLALPLVLQLLKRTKTEKRRVQFMQQYLGVLLDWALEDDAVGPLVTFCDATMREPFRQKFFERSFSWFSEEQLTQTTERAQILILLSHPETQRIGVKCVQLLQQEKEEEKEKVLSDTTWFLLQGLIMACVQNPDVKGRQHDYSIVIKQFLAAMAPTVRIEALERTVRSCPFPSMRALCLHALKDEGGFRSELYKTLLVERPIDLDVASALLNSLRFFALHDTQEQQGQLDVIRNSLLHLIEDMLTELKQEQVQVSKEEEEEDEEEEEEGERGRHQRGLVVVMIGNRLLEIIHQES